MQDMSGELIYFIDPVYCKIDVMDVTNDLEISSYNKSKISVSRVILEGAGDEVKKTVGDVFFFKATKMIRDGPKGFTQKGIQKEWDKKSRA